ncbi:putative signaling protein [Methylobacterium hispanicum]|jgi:diguanylate cyclase (GGDEF)-like protein/PAS domain S-box-containing protein|uniref:Signaling protein n=1 Tax=Methylobacterium hispanicum TaxID=270350 RepID=A0AAV4ZEZ0_9HYPH|nr:MULTISPECIES: diguanylate cyclase [Methylobacterium]GJD86932.1 putative signaling protein [Methylobacterium hispanicum]
MSRMIGCLVDQHPGWVVPLAALVCWISSHTALRLLDQSRDSTGPARPAWLAAAGFSAGAGIWCTHFIGVLGYDPGIAIGYGADLTLLSLAAAILCVLAALALVRDATRPAAAVAAGLVLGLGVAAMHALGMASLQVPGVLVWDWPLAGAALAGGCALAAAAFLVRRRPRPGSMAERTRAVAATLMTGAVATLHFTAMAAVVIVPDLAAGRHGPNLPRLVLAGAVAGLMLTVLAFAALALFAERMRRANVALRASEAAHRLSEERLALAVDGDGLWDLALADGRMWLSDRWQSMLGYAPGELESHSRTLERLVHPDDAVQARRRLSEHLEGRAALYESEHRMRRQDGGWTWVLVRGKVVARDPSGRPARMVGLQADTTMRRAAERRIAHMALHDALTDLPNRTLFRERLNQLVVRARQHGGRFAVLACDLDRFKAVNDAHGHPAGDTLLGVIAERLRGVVRAGDTVARLGGDEFAILLVDLDTWQSAARVAERLIAAVDLPVDVGPATVRVGVSIGIAVGGGHEEAEALFKNADTALYRAKAEGRNVCRFFDAPQAAAAA